MKFTLHAQERWQQRCSHLDLTSELAKVKRASKRVVNTLRGNWERARGVGTWPAHQDYLTTPGGAVLIVCNSIVITVLTVRDLKRWERYRLNEERLRRRHTQL